MPFTAPPWLCTYCGWMKPQNVFGLAPGSSLFCNANQLAASVSPANITVDANTMLRTFLFMPAPIRLSGQLAICSSQSTLESSIQAKCSGVEYLPICCLIQHSRYTPEVSMPDHPRSDVP